MRLLASALTLITAALLSLVAGSGISHAGLDNQLSVVDGKGRTMTVQQWDTFLNGVVPLDKNRLTREWFHSGKAEFTVTGHNADQFSGTLQLGYQVGIRWSLGVGVNFSYTTPNVLLDKASVAPQQFNPLGSVITPNLFPGVSVKANLGNGPGIQEVNTFPVDVKGANGTVAVSNAHGTVTGAAGGVLLRPFARLISKAGDSVTTYGDAWNMN